MTGLQFAQLIGLIQKYNREKENYRKDHLTKSEYIYSCEELLEDFVSISKQLMNVDMSNLNDNVKAVIKTLID